MVKASWVQLWIEVKRPGGKLHLVLRLTFRMNVRLSLAASTSTGGVDEVVDWLKARGVVK